MNNDSSLAEYCGLDLCDDVMSTSKWITMAVSLAAYNYLLDGAYLALCASIPGPFFLTLLLMFVSGLTLLGRLGVKET